MKYAHLADAHLGSWRDLKMRELATQSFLKAVDDCMAKQVDFILFTGDLFNTSLPALDILKIITQKLKELQEKNIPFYAVPGSHDYSPSGKTMIDVLEKAGLLVNVCKGEVNSETKELNLIFTQDPKTKAKITGMMGKKGMLDRIYYESLNREPLESEPGYKIFLFHTTLTELKPKHLEKIDSQPLSFLPKNFNYYAGGHIHHPTKVNQAGWGTFTYPGALFPNNFMELEQYSHGNYYLIETSNSVDDQKIELIPVKLKEHLAIEIDCKHKTPEVIAFDILQEVSEKEIKDCLITIRLKGTLDQGKTSDIDFKRIFDQLYQKGAHLVMKNTSRLQSVEFEEIKLNTSTPQEIETELIKEHLQQIKLFSPEKELQLTKNSLHSLNTEKKEGETITDFQRRLVEEMNQILELEKEMGES